MNERQAAPYSSFITHHSSLPLLTPPARISYTRGVGTPPIQFPTDSTEEMPFAPQPQATPGPAPHVAPDPDNPPWGLLAALGLLVITFGLMIVSSLAFLIPYVIYRKVSLPAFAEFAVKDPGAILVQILSIIPAHLLTLVAAWFIVTRAGKYPFL